MKRLVFGEKKWSSRGRRSEEGFDADSGQANRAGCGPDRCDGLGVVPVCATRASAIASPAATAATAATAIVIPDAVHRQRRDRSRGHGADVLLREPWQMLQETAQIQRIPEQGQTARSCNLVSRNPNIREIRRTSQLRFSARSTFFEFNTYYICRVRLIFECWIYYEMVRGKVFLVFQLIF